ncbi:hypothetical protein Hdeb2414_s0019g00549361 [Helianthus debilis subsp. tardiflorus]
MHSNKSCHTFVNNARLRQCSSEPTPHRFEEKRNIVIQIIQPLSYLILIRRQDFFEYGSVAFQRN